jgi:hypothetical protein
MTKEEWVQWKNNSTTKLVVERLNEVRDKSISDMLNLDITREDFSLEKFALHSIALRYQIEGLSEFLDFNNLEVDLVDEAEKD